MENFAFHMCYSILTSLFVVVASSALLFSILGRSFVGFFVSMAVQGTVVMWNIITEMPFYQRWCFPSSKV